MFIPGPKQRVRPSKKSLGLSVVIFPVAVYFAFLLFVGYYLSIPMGIALVVAFAVALFRTRGVMAGLPEPYGRGKVSTLDVDKAARQGVLTAVAGGLATFGVLSTVYLFPPVVFFSLVMGLTAGLPLSEIVFFLLVARLERKSQSRIFLITEDVEEGGKPAIKKTFSMTATPTLGLLKSISRALRRISGALRRVLRRRAEK